MMFATQELIALKAPLRFQEPIAPEAITVHKVQLLQHPVRLVPTAVGLEGLLFLIAIRALEDMLVQLTQ